MALSEFVRSGNRPGRWLSAFGSRSPASTLAFALLAHCRQRQSWGKTKREVREPSEHSLEGRNKEQGQEGVTFGDGTISVLFRLFTVTSSFL